MKTRTTLEWKTIRQLRNVMKLSQFHNLVDKVKFTGRNLKSQFMFNIFGLVCLNAGFHLVLHPHLEIPESRSAG